MNELIKLLLANNVEMTILKDIQPRSNAIRVMFIYANYYFKRVIIDMDEIEAAKVPIETVLYSHLDRFLKDMCE